LENEKVTFHREKEMEIENLQKKYENQIKLLKEDNQQRELDHSQKMEQIVAKEEEFKQFTKIHNQQKNEISSLKQWSKLTNVAAIVGLVTITTVGIIFSMKLRR